MKDIQKVILEKQKQITRVRVEIESLKFVIQLLEENPPPPPEPEMILRS